VGHYLPFNNILRHTLHHRKPGRAINSTKKNQEKDEKQILVGQRVLETGK
jgi:chorismate synthase